MGRQSASTRMGLRLLFASVCFAVLAGCAAESSDDRAAAIRQKEPVKGRAKMAPDEDKRDLWAAVQTTPRDVPGTDEAHSCNVYVVGEEVAFKLSVSKGTRADSWRLVDYDSELVSSGTIEDARQDGPLTFGLGKLPVGYYRLEILDADGNCTEWTSAAVLARLAEPVPQDSPICADSATAWFARENEARQERFAALGALAGLNWMRDRMSWGHMQRTPDGAAERTYYDSSADLQNKHGLKVLQVFHHTPGWAIDKELDGEHAGKRFPRDLRHLYGFCKAMSVRFKGRVQAWESWNEANIPPFGGHTIDEMCTHQKAAYFGFKDGDPGVTVCWNVYAGSGTMLHTEGVIQNEAWPYFETFNIHSYGRPEGYLKEFDPARIAACGRPIWITECGIRLLSKTDAPWGEMSREDERKQAEFLARSYASSLFAGVNRHFFFILGNYIERGVQFGLLRHDQTPRPGYVALAALGRLLAGARCLGRMNTEDNPSVHAYAFSARPDGRQSDVLVIWSEDAGNWTHPPGMKPVAVLDHLGRERKEHASPGLATGPAPTFVLLAPGEAAKLPLEKPPTASAHRSGEPCRVVLQLSMPEQVTSFATQAHLVQPGVETELPLYVYNFSQQTVRGSVTVESLPDDWKIEPKQWDVRLAPMDRKLLPARILVPPKGRRAAFGDWIRLRGDFPGAGKPVLAFRLASMAELLTPQALKTILSASEPANWQDNIVGGARMSHGEAEGGGVLFEMHFAESDPWAYPRFKLKDEEVPDSDCDGLSMTVQVLEGEGDVRVQFVEDNGAHYLAETTVDAAQREPQKTTALFWNASWGGWSKPDPDRALQPQNIRTVCIGINSERNSTVRMIVRDLAWIRF